MTTSATTRLCLIACICRAPLKEQQESVLLDDIETQPLEQSPRTVETLDVDAQPFARLPRLIHQLSDQPRANFLTAQGREQSDVHNANLVCAAINVEPARRLAIDQNDLML